MPIAICDDYTEWHELIHRVKISYFWVVVKDKNKFIPMFDFGEEYIDQTQHYNEAFHSLWVIVPIEAATRKDK